VCSREGLRKAKPQSQRKKEKRTKKREKRREAKKRRETTHTHIVTKMSCTLLTIHPSLLPKYKPSYTHTMPMLALNTQRMTV